jgi:hypothetical protein
MEFMLGIGPEWIHSNGYGVKMNSVGADVVPDFMFWPAKKHRFGWYLEPSYEYKTWPWSGILAWYQRRSSDLHSG